MLDCRCHLNFFQIWNELLGELIYFLDARVKNSKIHISQSITLGRSMESSISNTYFRMLSTSYFELCKST